jgi:hypothetical protein
VCAFDFGAFAIVAESSANLRSCRGVEQVIVTNDRELFRFYAEAIKLLPTHAKQ